MCKYITIFIPLFLLRISPRDNPPPVLLLPVVWQILPAFTLYTLPPTLKKSQKMRFLLHISPKSTTFASKYTQATMEHKFCPRCGAAFICQHENPAKCQCAGVELSPAARAHLAAQYPNQCLCRKCLLEFSV